MRPVGIAGKVKKGYGMREVGRGVREVNTSVLLCVFVFYSLRPHHSVR